MTTFIQSSFYKILKLRLLIVLHLIGIGTQSIVFGTNNENCKFSRSGSVCRPAISECDIQEVCTRQSHECPIDIYKKNGTICGNGDGYCFNRYCSLLTNQCKQIWDWEGKAAAKECYEYLNTGGHHNGHCGRNIEGLYQKCDKKNVMCGTLHCKDGTSNPTWSSQLQNNTYTKIILKLQGDDHECKSLSGPIDDQTLDQIELVRDGTKCNHNSICLNQTCMSIDDFIYDQTCPTIDINLVCSGHGDCSNINTCLCLPGWEGSDCSTQNFNFPTTKPKIFDFNNDPSCSISTMSSTTEHPHPGKETKYLFSNTNTLPFQVTLTLLIVFGVFLLFTVVTLCFRHHIQTQQLQQKKIEKIQQI